MTVSKFAVDLPHTYSTNAGRKSSEKHLLKGVCRSHGQSAINGDKIYSLQKGVQAHGSTKALYKLEQINTRLRIHNNPVSSSSGYSANIGGNRPLPSRLRHLMPCLVSATPEHLFLSCTGTLVAYVPHIPHQVTPRCHLRYGMWVA